MVNLGEENKNKRITLRSTRNYSGEKREPKPVGMNVIIYLTRMKSSNIIYNILMHAILKVSLI